MELREFLRTLARRWYLVLAVVLLTAAASYGAALAAGPRYESAGSTLVFPPRHGDEQQSNPYLELAGVTQTRDILVRSLASKNVRDTFAERFPTAEFEVTPDFTNSAPIILFRVEAATAAESADALRDLMGLVPETLADLQAGIDLSADERVTSMSLTQDATPQLLRKAQVRSAIVGAVAVLALGLLLLALVDSLLAARAERRTQASSDAPEPQSESTTDPSSEEASGTDVRKAAS